MSKTADTLGAFAYSVKLFRGRTVAESSLFSPHVLEVEVTAREIESLDRIFDEISKIDKYTLPRRASLKYVLRFTACVTGHVSDQFFAAKWLPHLNVIMVKLYTRAS